MRARLALNYFSIALSRIYSWGNFLATLFPSLSSYHHPPAKFSCLLLLADFLHQFHVRVLYIHVCGYCTATLTFTDHFLHYNTELAQLVSTTSYYSHCRVADKSLGTGITLDEEQPFCRRSYLSVSPHNPAIPPSCLHLSCRFAPCLGTLFLPITFPTAIAFYRRVWCFLTAV